MTTLLALRSLVAECDVCDLYAEPLPGSDVPAALRAFRALHPDEPGARHVRRIPDGWRVPLSGPGALSQ